MIISILLNIGLAVIAIFAIHHWWKWHRKTCKHPKGHHWQIKKLYMTGGEIAEYDCQITWQCPYCNAYRFQRTGRRSVLYNIGIDPSDYELYRKYQFEVKKPPALESLAERFEE